MIKLFSTFNDVKLEHTFELTVFPDKTSQCWKINPEPKGGQNFNIEWKYENEAEIFYLVQLAMIINQLTTLRPRLYSDTLPFARQDKPIGNNSTFALNAMMRILQPWFGTVHTIDAHSNAWNETPNGYFFPIHSEAPNERIRIVLKTSDTDIICFPDAGAAKRGYAYDEEQFGKPIILDKDRDQESGEIKGLKFTTKFTPNLKGYKIAIIDDICDGGKTFIEAAKLLKAQGAEKVFLYTTHGIYSKGTPILFESGIDRVFNYKEEISNGT